MRAPHGSSRATLVDGEAKANGDKSLGRRGGLGSLRLFTLARLVGSVSMFLSFENAVVRSIGASWGPSSPRPILTAARLAHFAAAIICVVRP